MTAPPDGPGPGEEWPLRGLVRCGYCDQPMATATGPQGRPAYACTPPCGRSRVDAEGLEWMAYRTALAAWPTLTKAAYEVGQRAFFTETYRLIVVHGDLTDVRFVGHSM